MLKQFFNDFWLLLFLALLSLSVGLYIADIIVYPFGIFMFIIAILARSTFLKGR
jgi:hypothetical protein